MKTSGDRGVEVPLELTRLLSDLATQLAHSTLCDKAIEHLTVAKKISESEYSRLYKEMTDRYPSTKEL